MLIKSALIKGATRLQATELSREAAKRLKWFDYYYSRNQNARLTCRYFGVSPQTFYRWKRRYDPRHLGSLEDRPHRPKHLRQATASTELVEAVLKLREKHPRWGKEKLSKLLAEQEFRVCASMVGRILRWLKERGVLREPTLTYVSSGKRQRLRPYAQRKPKDYEAKQMGDLVQLDTLDIRPLPGVVLKHFTAHDVISRWDVIGVYHRSTAANAVHFLNALEQRMPFPLKAIR